MFKLPALPPSAAGQKRKMPSAPTEGEQRVNRSRVIHKADTAQRCSSGTEPTTPRALLLSKIFLPARMARGKEGL